MFAGVSKRLSNRCLNFLEYYWDIILEVVSNKIYLLSRIRVTGPSLISETAIMV
jgi:hypothetical protein